MNRLPAVFLILALALSARCACAQTIGQNTTSPHIVLGVPSAAPGQNSLGSEFSQQIRTYAIDPRVVLRARDRRCFAMRTYGFAPDEELTGAVRPTGYSTCQPASSVSEKRAKGQQVR